MFLIKFLNNNDISGDTTMWQRSVFTISAFNEMAADDGDNNSNYRDSGEADSW